MEWNAAYIISHSMPDFAKCYHILGGVLQFTPQQFLHGLHDIWSLKYYKNIKYFQPIFRQISHHQINVINHLCICCNCRIRHKRKVRIIHYLFTARHYFSLFLEIDRALHVQMKRFAVSFHVFRNQKRFFHPNLWQQIANLPY